MNHTKKRLEMKRRDLLKASADVGAAVTCIPITMLWIYRPRHCLVDPLCFLQLFPLINRVWPGMHHRDAFDRIHPCDAIRAPLSSRPDRRPAFPLRLPV